MKEIELFIRQSIDEHQKRIDAKYEALQKFKKDLQPLEKEFAGYSIVPLYDNGKEFVVEDELTLDKWTGRVKIELYDVDYLIASSYFYIDYES